ncbi:MAG TPA: Ldh family oxidoreductase [Streptosporangiaceae bacterium]|jgi:LDH2 family malate/lactate/ureidoglycolate dehydrogenase|nr:Ldh family oxidoreductase [Streptosporangiaceae bacterium]
MTPDGAPDRAELYPADQLAEFATAALAALGAPEAVAAQVARSLVLSNLVGHDSHGVIRLVQYSEFIGAGQVRPSATAEITGTRGASGVVDGAWGFGQPAAQLATGLAIKAASTHAVAAVTIRNCNHVGRLGEYVTDLAEAGLMGMAFCNSGAVVAPFGGTGRALGTNPFAWAAPGGPGGPLVVDFSTAGVAEGKLRVAAAEGRGVAEGLIVDARGLPSARPEDFFAGGALLPFGGHKGSGMSVMIELLGGLLTGMGTACTPGYAGGNGTVLLAVDLAAFTDPGAYQAGAREFCAALVAVGAGPSGGNVLLPGEVESRTRQQRLRDGIPVSRGVLALIYRLTDRLGVERLRPRPQPELAR